MMPGESRSQAAEVVAADAVTAGSVSCMNCDTLQQNLNEYITALIALKQKIIDTDHVLTEYQKKCDELQKTERDCKTLRDQLDELLQKFAPVEKCKEEMDAMRVELEEKRSSVKMYQQTHLEFNELQQEQARNDAVKKKLESRVKKMEETTSKQNAEIRQLKKEKATLERKLKKTQDKLMLQQKNGIKVLKDAQTQNVVKEVPTKIDTNKVKVLLEEIWMCIEKPNAQESPNKSTGKQGPSQKKCKTVRSSLSNPSHSSPLETSELPTSSPPHQLECDQEEIRLSKMDESLIDEGLKNNGDSAFYEDKTIELTGQKDLAASPTASSTDTDDAVDDDEQDALSRQLQEILDWTEPLPPQLSPLPCSPSNKKILFGDITDSSDDESSNLPGRSSESVPETEQLDSSGCTEVLITDQTSMAEAGISSSMVGELSVEKMDCSEAETEDLNEHVLTKTEVEGEMPDPCLVVQVAQCRNEESKEVQSLSEETLTRTPEMYNVKNLTSPQHNYNDDMQGNDTTESSKNTVVPVTYILKTVEPEPERSKPCSKEEYGLGTFVKEVEARELASQEASSFGKLGTNLEATEAEVHCTSNSLGDESIVASVLPSDMEHTTSASAIKEQIGASTVEEVIPLTKLDSKVVHDVAQDNSAECIPPRDMQVEEINGNSFTSDRQKGECTQTLLPPTVVKLPQVEPLTNEQIGASTVEEVIPLTKLDSKVVHDVAQDNSAECIPPRDMQVEEINGNSFTSDRQKGECTQTLLPPTVVKLPQVEPLTNEKIGASTVEEVMPLTKLDSKVVHDVAQDNSAECIPPRDMQVEEINGNSFTSDRQKGECTQILLPPTVVKLPQVEPLTNEQSLYKIEEAKPSAEAYCSMETGQNLSKDCISPECAEMEEMDSGTLIPDNQNNESTRTSVPASGFEQTHTAFVAEEQSELDKMQEIAPRADFDCSIETTVSQDKSNNFVSEEDTEMENICSVSSLSDNQKVKCTLTLSNDIEESVTKEPIGLDRIQETAVLGKTDNSVITDVAKDTSEDSVCTGTLEINNVDSKSSTSGSPNNELTVPSEEECIQHGKSVLIIKEKDSLNKLEEISSLQSECSLIAGTAQNSSISRRDMEMNEVDSNSSTSDRQQDEYISTFVPISTQLTQAESTTRGHDCLKVEQASPLVEFDSGVLPDRCKDFVSPHVLEMEDDSSSECASIECTLISVESSIDEPEIKFTIKEYDIITRAKEASSFLESDCSFMVTDLAQDKSADCTSTMGISNKCDSFLSTWSESTEDTEMIKCMGRESPVDKWDEGKDQLMENEEKGKSDIGEINDPTLNPSGECTSSVQIAPQFEINTYSTQSTSPDELQGCIGQESLIEVGQNKARDTLNNNVEQSEENASSEKSEDIHLKSRRRPGKEIPLQESGTASPQICEMNPQNSEAEVSMLVRKVKRKQWHRKIPTPQGETEAIDQKVVEREIATEVCTSGNLNRELQVQTGVGKLETEHHTPSVNGRVTVQCDELPFDSKRASESHETGSNSESITHSKDESAIYPECIESTTEPVTLDEKNRCQTPVGKTNADMNYENADENGDNTMSVKCEASTSALDLDTSALHVCDNESFSELGPSAGKLLGCTQIENENLVKNTCQQNETEAVEMLKNSLEVCSNQDSNVCVKEHFGSQMEKNTIGIAEKVPNCISNRTMVNNSTNTPLGTTCSHISFVQRVDSSTQTENDDSQMVLYTGSDLLLTAPKSVPQVDFVEEGEVGTPKAKRHASYCDLRNPFIPDTPSDHQRPVHTVGLNEEGALFENTGDNLVDGESFGTSKCEQTSKKTAKSRKPCGRLPADTIEADGDAQQNGGLQKADVQSTSKSRVGLRRNKRGSNPNNPPAQTNTDTSTPALCTQEIHQVMLEMGKPLPPLLPPLVATPPRTARAAKPVSPLIKISSIISLSSPADHLASPSKETSKTASVSPPLDYSQQKSPSMHSPSPLEFASNERIQSSPLQFCTTTPKHAVPVPGRLPQSASSTGGSALPQENSVKILDAMYPNLSARARTLNILRGNVQLSIRGPTDSEPQAGAVNQIMGFKAINSATTAFVKAVSNNRSEGAKADGREKELEQQQPDIACTSGTVEKPRRKQMAAKRSAEDNGAGKAKRPKTENKCQTGDVTTDSITPQETSTVNVIDATQPISNRLEEQQTKFEHNLAEQQTELEHISQPLESINSDDEAVASALMKITRSCFDLLPVLRSHVFVGNIPQLPVLRDEEKEVICELSGNKDLTEALLMAIIKKLKAEQTTLDGNCLQALSRVYVAICRQQGDLERARLLSYSILKEDFPDSSKLLLLILSVWRSIFSMQGPVNKAMQAVAKQRAKGDVLNCLSAYLSWEKNSPLDVSSLVSSFLIAMQQSPKVRFQTSDEYGMDFNGDMWELIYAIDLLCSQQPWTWTHDCFIRKEVWPVMDKWMKRRKGQNSILHIKDVTVAGVMRLIGCLGQQGLKKESLVAVKNMAAVINKFLQHACQEGVPWPVQLSAVYAVYDLAPSNPVGAMEALHTWRASVTEQIPSAASNCLMELDQRLNSEITNPSELHPANF
ncbi:little elongation complex subunit 1 isoform X2 [Scyliorhinus canicula]|uniref:little elongation complex subunit 1 isoform X2 n=1 Tax=Scyliorhinus canicula TaxID=7830 RepID=UPI0018F6EDF2|nr:little elongation complex subunit 1 isoform X2 [Scyliorhinus canicula]